MLEDRKAIRHQQNQVAPQEAAGSMPNSRWRSGRSSPLLREFRVTAEVAAEYKPGAAVPVTLLMRAVGTRPLIDGRLPVTPLRSTVAEPLPPAPQSEFGWQMEPYVQHWKAELTYWIEHHAIHGTELPVDDSHLVNPLERLGAFEVSGWRESTP